MSPQTTIGIQTQFSGTGAGAAEVALGKVGATASKAERDLLAYAATVARAQRAQGDAAGAIKTYESALSQVNATTKQAIGIQAQLAATMKGMQVLPRTLEAFGSEALDQMKQGLLGIVGPAALVTAAFGALRGAADLTVAGENVNRVARSFESLAVQAGTSGNAILEALRKASGGEISDLNIQLAADKGLLLGVASSAKDFAAIMEIARDRAAKMGITTTQAFDDITTGIGRESPRILDNLGIIVDLDAAHQAYAQSIGKTVDELSKAERIEALRDAVIAQGRGTLDAATTAINDQTNAYARLGVAIENARNRLGAYLSTETQHTAAAAADILSIDGSAASFTRAGNSAATAAPDVTKYLNALNPVAQITNVVSSSNAFAIEKFNELAGTSLPTTFFQVNGLTEAWNRLTGAMGATPIGVPGSDRLKDDLDQITQKANNAATAVVAALGGAAPENRHVVDTGEGVQSDKTFDFSGHIKHQKLAAQQAERLADVLFQNRLKKAKTTSDKIALLREKEAGITDPVERARIEGQIIDLQISGAKAYTSELDKQTKLIESQYDARNKQINAELSLRELTIQDRQDSRKEARDLARLSRVVGGRQFSAEQQAAAQDQIDLININRAQRAQKITEAGATANASLSTSGQLLQSKPGGGGVAPLGPQTTGGIAPFAPAQGATVPFNPAVAAPAVTMNIYIQDGKLTKADAGGGTLNVFLNAAQQTFASGG